MLTYEDETISQSCGVSDSPAAAWTAPANDRQDRTGGAALAALAGTSIADRFCSWIGSSGRRYVFSVYPAAECPAFRDAVLLAAVRDMTGQRRAVLSRDTGAFPEPVVAKAQRQLMSYGPGLEFHLHLMAASPAERAATIADLAVAQG
jgi:hypothetical protein